MDEPEIDVRRILGTVRRQWRIIATAIVASLALAGLAVFALTPIFSASTLVLVDPREKNLLDPNAQVISSSAADSARVDSEVELVRSDSVLLRVIQDMDLVNSDEFGPTLGLRGTILSALRIGTVTLPTGAAALGQTLAKLKSAISVQRRGLTYLINLEVRSESPQLSADIANALARAYIDDQVQSKVQSILTSKAVLAQRIAEARAALAVSETSFDQFIQENLDSIAQTSSRSDIRNLQRRFDLLQSSRERLASTADLLSESLERQDWQTIVANLQNDALQSLERQRQELADQLTEAGTGSPVAVDLRARLAEIEEQMADAAQTQVSTLQQDIAQSENLEDELRQQLRTVVLEGELPAEILTQLYEVQQNAQLARDQYQNLLARSQDLDAQANLQIADSRVVSPALPPTRPAFPNNILIFAIALLGGIGVGVALAFLYENFLGGFVSEEQLDAVLRTKTSSVVPAAKMPSESESLASLLIKSPLSAYSEAIRRLRAAIEQNTARTPKEKKSLVVMVSSTIPHEGKSTLSLALGRSYALAGYSTILIDADLRKPSIHRHVGTSIRSGLIDYLKSKTADHQVVSDIIHTDESGLCIVLGGHRSDVPTDQLIDQPAFKRLIDTTRKTFDVTVIDTPPVGLVVDGLYVAEHADVVVFATKYASTPQADARKAMNLLRNAVGPDVSVVTVLNGVPQSQSNYYRKYGSYYVEAQS
mgnify:CR=1 FL=1